jgi:protoporphyrinogen/coproporphyrinogen III oxidase
MVGTIGGMRIVVVGGGIAGLAAAHRASSLGADVLVVEQSPVVGGKLRAAALPSGEWVEAGAEAFAVRDPQTGAPSAAADLVEELGLAGELRQPGISRAAVATGPGDLAPIPAGTLFGIPSDAAAERWPDTGPLLGPGEDVAVGRLVRARLGDEVADRLVDPMLGGVYAGRADELSLATTIPALAAACREHGTLTGAVRAVLAERPRDTSPLFATLHSGLSSLAVTLAERIGPRRISTGRPARALHRARGDGWRLTVGSARDPMTITADGVVLAAPARPAARLLADVDPAVAADVGALDYASVALVTLVLPDSSLPELSGFLVPADSAYTIKAATFLDRKWPHLRRPGRTLVRLSLGRHGEEGVLQRPDADLVAIAAADLADLIGTPREPVEAAVHRWGGGLPQYAPGHLDRVAAARKALQPGLALAGAGYEGVGIPACVRSGRVAAEEIVRSVG